jgi:hypothetical protein
MRPQYEISHAVDASKTSTRPKKDLGGREIEKALPARPFFYNLSASLVLDQYFVCCESREADTPIQYTILRKAEEKVIGIRLVVYR